MYFGLGVKEMIRVIGFLTLLMSFESIHAASFFGFGNSKDREIICRAEKLEEFDYDSKLDSLNPFYGDSNLLEKNEVINGSIAKDLYYHIIEEFMKRGSNPISQLISLHAVLEMMQLAVINADLNKSFLQDSDSKPRIWERKKWNKLLSGKKKKATKRSEKNKQGEKSQIGDDERVFVLKWDKTMDNYNELLNENAYSYSTPTKAERDELKKVSLIYIDHFVECLDLILIASAGGTETPYLVEAREKARSEAKDYLRDYRNDTTSWAILWNSMLKGSLFPEELVRKAVKSKVTFLTFMFENKYILDMLSGVNYEISQYDEFFNARVARKILKSLYNVKGVNEAKEFKVLFDILVVNLENYLKNKGNIVTAVPEVKLLEDSENLEERSKGET